ncbi:hypothetical protein I203_106258 [Kwoniella mangroviensis CBS 8507]|uniref:uncharacterized protein n=1 Tax=Kwoniella mangroviensis CBS 8507 TaxID=1296122 RepID=UPI00080D5FAF|nr:uncharacterized protein I203_04731 [Kwoniella mangroviensis CBS 8507]OCF66398.1 hypothetical protein I203_04731 [Kwoniella mangroviensis CBS 8507]
MTSPPKTTSPPPVVPATASLAEQHEPPPGPPPPASVATQPVHADPKVVELHQMFPTVEISVIELILETSQGSTDRAIEQLLGMTDPEFKSDELGGTREDAQVDLDAQFARSLQMADEESYRQQQAEFHSRVNSGNNPPPAGGLPYQPRIRRGQRQPAQAQPYSEQDLFYQNRDQGLDDRYGQQQQRDGNEGQNPPGMLAFEEKVEKFAEAGKQTLNSLFSRAKAKYSEFQAQQAQNRTNQGSSGSGYVPENLSPSGDRYTRPPGIGGNRGGEQNRNLAGGGGGGGLWDSRSPSLRSESISSQSTFDAPPQSQAQVPLRQSSNRWQPSDAYDDPLPPARTMSGNRIEITSGRSTNSGVGSPEKQIGKIDPAKLGILPKKRVDLLSTSPSSSTNTGTNVLSKKDNDDEDDPNPSLPNAPESLVSKIPPTPPAGDDRYRLEDSDDELEYTKNPFDEK